MTPNAQARSGYAAAAGPTRSERDIEYAVFARITHRMRSVDEADRAAFPKLAAAVYDNQRLWGALADDLLHGGNALPVPPQCPDPGRQRPAPARRHPPDAANTPVKRVCYIAQLVLAGEADPDEARRQLLRGIEQLSQVFQDPDSRAHLTAATEAVAASRFYQAMRALRCLMPRKARLLGARP